MGRWWVVLIQFAALEGIEVPDTKFFFYTPCRYVMTRLRGSAKVLSRLTLSSSNYHACAPPGEGSIAIR